MKVEEGGTGDAQPAQTVVKKKTAGEIRLRKDLGELDLPLHATTNFPDPNNVMKFEVFVDLSKE